MATLQSYELDRYQSAAEQVCMRLGENPWELVPTECGLEPAWTQYAVRMHELRLMTEAMQQYGIPL